MDYLCKTEGGRHFAVIEDGGKELDRAAAPSKFAAMEMRERARNADVKRFAHIDNPPPVEAKALGNVFEGATKAAPKRERKPKPAQAKVEPPKPDKKPAKAKPRAKKKA